MAWEFSVAFRISTGGSGAGVLPRFPSIIPVSSQPTAKRQKRSKRCEGYRRDGTIEIIKTLEKKGGMRYSGIEEMIGSPSTASRRLNELERLGIVKREALPDKYRPVKYSLTKKGEGLFNLIKEIEGLF